MLLLKTTLADVLSIMRFDVLLSLSWLCFKMYLDTEFNFLFESFQQILATQCPTIVLGK